MLAVRWIKSVIWFAFDVPVHISFAVLAFNFLKATITSPARKERTFPPSAILRPPQRTNSCKYSDTQAVPLSGSSLCFLSVDDLDKLANRPQVFGLSVFPCMLWNYADLRWSRRATGEAEGFRLFEINSRGRSDALCARLWQTLSNTSHMFGLWARLRL